MVVVGIEGRIFFLPCLGECDGRRLSVRSGLIGSLFVLMVVLDAFTGLVFGLVV